MAEENLNPNHERSLGQIGLPNNAFDLDLRINEGFQNYAAELLRISLLVMTGLAVVWLRLIFTDKSAVTRDLSFIVSYSTSFISLVVSASAALFHRNTAAYGLTYQLEALRLLTRDRPGRDGKQSDKEIAQGHRRRAKRNYRISGQLLKLSMVALICGIVAFGWSMLEIMLRADMQK